MTNPLNNSSMQRSLPRESLSIKNIDLDQSTIPDWQADQYTLLLIRTGEGSLVIDGNQAAYQPGDVFFLGIGVSYRFLSTQRTNAYWLMFSPSFVNNLLTTDSPGWTFLNPSMPPCRGSLTADARDQANLQALAAIILSEERSLRPLTENPIVDGLMKTLLSLVDRLFMQRGVTAPAPPTFSSDIIRRVIAYIGQHICEPQRLRMEVMASEFNYSPGHLSALFRQQTGDSIQQFIIRHKLNRVALRLRHTSLTVSQIADEFGFSDVCHLNKHFKRHYRHTPTIYRQSLLA